MTVDEALGILDKLLGHKHLSSIYELVFRQSWEGKTYNKIAIESGYDYDYIKEIGSSLWHLLAESLGEKTTKKNIHSVFRRYAEKQSKETTNSNSLNFSAEPDVVSHLVKTPKPKTSNNCNPLQDWGEAIDVSIFYGRLKELAKLEQWIVQDRCRMVAILGIGGIGKTSLSVTLAEEIQCNFKYIIWRSLHNAPSLMEKLENLIQVLSDHQEINLPQTLSDRISLFISYLRKYRCLIIFDQIESILCEGDHTSSYLDGYDGYGELWQRVGESQHQSCLVITSREQPKEFDMLEGDKVRSFYLGGLNTSEAKEIFKLKGNFIGSNPSWEFLVNRYGGNPMVLKIVASAVGKFFDYDVSRLVDLLTRERWGFGGITELLDQHFERLSETEKEVMYWMTIHQQLPSFADLLATGKLPIKSSQEFLGVLDSLRRRSLIEKRKSGYKQNPLFIEYMTEKIENSHDQT